MAYAPQARRFVSRSVGCGAGVSGDRTADRLDGTIVETVVRVVPSTASRELAVNIFRRYWMHALVVAIVLLHAAIVGYVRRQVINLRQVQSAAIGLGTFRVQPLTRLDTLYQLNLHAEIEPGQRAAGEELLKRQRVGIRVAVEHVLRESTPELLEPAAIETLHDRLLEAVSDELGVPVIRRLLITDWLILPVDRVLVSPDPPDALAAR